MSAEELFYATCRDLAPGEVVRAVARKISQEQDVCEDKLASHSSTVANDRRNCLFTSNDALFAATYLMAENRPDCERKLYKVTMPSASRHPMALVSLVCHETTTACAARLATEYWSPSLAWRCWEFIGQEFTVIEEAIWPPLHELAGARYRYLMDREAGRRHCTNSN